MTTDIPSTNRRIVLAAYPRGLPVDGDFALEKAPVPAPAEGQLLLRTLALSIDPYMRNLMDAVGPGYAPPVALGQTMVGATVSRVIATRHPRFATGELVLANAGWQDFALSDGSDLLPLGDDAHPTHALGGLGMPGFTAQVGLHEVGRVRPGDTVVVAAATGAVGAMVGQLARLAGARVVGIAGGAGKCRHAVEALGFDACIDRHDPALRERLADACPDGIDLYFENVGGAVFDVVMPLLNVGARVPVCGFVAHYNDEGAASGPDRLPAWTATVLQKRIRMQGFIVLDHYGDGLQHFDAFRRAMAPRVADGSLRLHEQVVDGLAHAPAALRAMLQGRHVGKTIVRVASD